MIVPPRFLVVGAEFVDEGVGEFGERLRRQRFLFSLNGINAVNPIGAERAHFLPRIREREIRRITDAEPFDSRTAAIDEVETLRARLGTPHRETRRDGIEADSALSG